MMMMILKSEYISVYKISYTFTNTVHTHTYTLKRQTKQTHTQNKLLLLSTSKGKCTRSYYRDISNTPAYRAKKEENEMKNEKQNVNTI